MEKGEKLKGKFEIEPLKVRDTFWSFDYFEFSFLNCIQFPIMAPVFTIAIFIVENSQEKCLFNKNCPSTIYEFLKETLLSIGKF